MLDRQPAHVRRVIGLAGQYAAVEEAMTGRENLEMVARLFGLDRRDANAATTSVLEQLGLTDDADRLVRTYSGGMRRRLDLGASLVGSPRLLLLDEPTTGLDPRSRIELWDAIRGLVAAGTDVLLTTQYLDEADQLAHDIVIIDHGTVIAAGTPAELKSTRRTRRDRGPRPRRRATSPRPPMRSAASPTTPGSTRPPDASPSRWTPAPTDSRDAVRLLDALGIAVEDIALRRPTLDEVFLTLTGRPGDAPGIDHRPRSAPRRGAEPTGDPAMTATTLAPTPASIGDPRTPLPAADSQQARSRSPGGRSASSCARPSSSS